MPMIDAKFTVKVDDTKKEEIKSTASISPWLSWLSVKAMKTKPSAICVSRWRPTKTIRYNVPNRR